MADFRYAIVPWNLKLSLEFMNILLNFNNRNSVCASNIASENPEKTIHYCYKTFCLECAGRALDYRHCSFGSSLSFRWSTNGTMEHHLLKFQVNISGNQCAFTFYILSLFKYNWMYLLPIGHRTIFLLYFYKYFN